MNRTYRDFRFSRLPRMSVNSKFAIPSKHFFKCGCTLVGSLVSDKISSNSSLDKKKNLRDYTIYVAICSFTISVTEKLPREVKTLLLQILVQAFENLLQKLVGIFQRFQHFVDLDNDQDVLVLSTKHRVTPTRRIP